MLCIWCGYKLKVRLAVTCSAPHLYITDVGMVSWRPYITELIDNIKL